MISYREVVNGIRELNIDRSKPVIAHASLSAFGEVRGGAETLLGAVLSITDRLMMPAFTFKTMLVPEVGPEDNGLVYGCCQDNNRMAEFFRPDMPADPLMGTVAETLRLRRDAQRSTHPILSFTGVNVDSILSTQTIEEPLAPINDLYEQEGWVLLLGVNHTVNTSIHLAEKLAGRKQFVRWALTSEGVRECPGYPGCSDGFEKAAEILKDHTRTSKIGEARIRALPIHPMVETLKGLFQEDPTALLCDRMDCERCSVVRYLANAQTDG